MQRMAIASTAKQTIDEYEDVASADAGAVDHGFAAAVVPSHRRQSPGMAPSATKIAALESRSGVVSSGGVMVSAVIPNSPYAHAVPEPRSATPRALGYRYLD